MILSFNSNLFLGFYRTDHDPPLACGSNVFGAMR